MSELQEAVHLLERAEQAAMGGDFVSADELLKEAARIQEKELGPGHPDLANTLNNLAIVAEKTGRPAEAETLYRRAAAIAAAALPPDHPMVVESRQNLEDFCRAHSVALDVPAPPPTVAPRPDPRPAAPISSQPVPPTATAGKPSHSLAWLAAGTVFLVVVVLLLSRSCSSRETSTPVSAPEPRAAQPADAAPPPATAPRAAPIEQTNPLKAASRERDPQAATVQSSAPGAITLAIAQVCRGFSTSSSTWRCDPVGSSATPGSIVFYTRVRSPRDTTVVHRWYHGNTLRQSVRLGIQGNATEGYRTYSRQTVSDGDWRVEARSADGALLHEQRFVVQ